MARIEVKASTSYDVLIDELSFDEVGKLVESTTDASRTLIISDTNVAPLYAERVADSLSSSKIESFLHVIAAGEASKTISTYAQCLEACCQAGLSRNDVIIALGGGVVGDIAGFTAATYMRGCSCIQVPTSLLACVDSSVGGKTAVDLPSGKNLAGCFFQPNAVLIDTSALSTLDPHYFTDGCAEVIKYGAIADARLLDDLSTSLTPEDPRLPQVIERCVSIKRDIVTQDEFESGIRQTLNFGHTLGHAIERLSGYSVSHGYAVACGMALCAQSSLKLGLMDEDAGHALLAAIKAAHLPTRLPELDLGALSADDLYQAALTDKKRHGSVMNVVIAASAGQAEIKPMELEEFAAFIRLALEGESNTCRPR